MYAVFEDGTEDFLDEYTSQQQLASIQIRMELPLLVTGKFIRLELSCDELYLKNGKIYELVLRLPIHVDSETVRATFHTQTRQLNVTLTVLY